jgi:hypothetical protein
MRNFDPESIEFLQTLTLSDKQRERLIEVIEWEKELSWSAGYGDCEDQLN